MNLVLVRFITLGCMLIRGFILECVLCVCGVSCFLMRVFSFMFMD